MDSMERWLNAQEQVQIDDVRGARNVANVKRILAIVGLPRKRALASIFKRIKSDGKRGISAGTSVERQAAEAEELGF